eukprot:SAG31_NODE_73_length_27793_cov_26.900520_8_plen_65_part_00
MVRLTTDDDSIIEYYNSIDNEVELNMEVLDDIASEAREIANVRHHCSLVISDDLVDSNVFHEHA